MKLLAPWSLMSQQFDLTQMSLDELVSLSKQIEVRIRYLKCATAPEPQMATGSTPASCHPSRSPSHATCHVEEPSTGDTMSERVRGLIQTNDPWEGSGVGPTRWSQPFYGGSIIRDPGVIRCVPMPRSTDAPRRAPLYHF